jgi:hypothetical protein
MNLKLPKKFRKFLGYKRQPEFFTSLSELLPQKFILPLIFSHRQQEERHPETEIKERKKITNSKV